MSKFFSNWCNWISLFFSAVLFYVGSVQSDQDIFPFNYFRDDSARIWCINNSSIIILSLLILIWFFQYLFFKKEQNLQRKWIERLFEHITNQHLSGGAYNTRITIFCLSRGWHYFFPHFFKWVQGKESIAMIPNPLKKYLSIYVRYCSVEQRKKSYTYFRLHESTNDKPQSLAAECFKKCEPIKCMTEDISELMSSISLSKTFDDIINNERIVKYMKASHITDFETFKMLNQKANSI